MFSEQQYRTPFFTQTPLYLHSNRDYNAEFYCSFAAKFEINGIVQPNSFQEENFKARKLNSSETREQQ